MVYSYVLRHVLMRENAMQSDAWRGETRKKRGKRGKIIEAPCAFQRLLLDFGIISTHKIKSSFSANLLLQLPTGTKIYIFCAIRRMNHPHCFLFAESHKRGMNRVEIEGTATIFGHLLHVTWIRSVPGHAMSRINKRFCGCLNLTPIRREMDEKCVGWRGF